MVQREIKVNLLYHAGFVLGPREEADALEAMAITPVRDPERFRLTLRAVLPRSLKQQKLFDYLQQGSSLRQLQI